MRAFLRPFAVGFTLAAAGPGVAATSTFDLTIAGIRLGQVTLQTDENGGSYAAASRIQTAGIVGALADYYFDGRSNGRLTADGGVVPARFVADSRSPRADRHTEIEFKDGSPVRVSVEPPRSSAPDPASQAGTIDPVSAGFAVLRDAPPGEICRTSVDIFDGSRRSRLRLGDPIAGEGIITCEGTYARVEGEAHTLSSQREFPFRLVFHANGTGLARLHRIETRTSFGTAVLERRP